MKITIDTANSRAWELRRTIEIINEALDQREVKRREREFAATLPNRQLAEYVEAACSIFSKTGSIDIVNTGDSTITLTGQAAEVAQVVPPPPPASSTPLPLMGDESEWHEPATSMVSPPATPNTQEPAGISQGETQSVTNEELDADDVPWDATIHSESRAKNANGTWRKRRNTKGVEVKTAVPGLENITPNSVPAPPSERKMVATMVRINGAQNVIHAPEGATDEELSVITGVPTTREMDLTGPQAGVLALAAQVPPPPPTAPPVIKTASQGSPVGTWQELMERVTKYFGQQKLTSNDITEVCATFNIGSIQECFKQTNLIPLVAAALDAKAGA